MEDIIFGRNAVMELLKSGRSVNRLFIAEGSRDSSIQKILALAKTAGIVVEFISRDKLDKICGGRHQGVAAKAAAVNYSTLEEILELAASKNELPGRPAKFRRDTEDGGSGRRARRNNSEAAKCSTKCDSL